VFFYYTDEQVAENEKNGISDAIRKEYYKKLKELDVLNLFNEENFNIGFDSKENLDKHYAGNTYNYFL